MQNRFFQALLLLLFVLISGWQVTVADEIHIVNEQHSHPSIDITFFTAASCEDCLEIKDILDELLVGFEECVFIEQYDIEADGQAYLEIFFEYCEQYATGNIAPPVMFIGDKYLVGTEDIIDNLNKTIEDAVNEMSIAYLSTDVDIAESNEPAISQKSQSKIVEKFNNFDIGAIVLAGLIDGINPCAFTTIIFFISMLSYLGKTKYQLIVVGIGFTVSVFITYLLLGLGLLGAAKSFLVGSGASRIVTYVVATLTFALALWSFIDFINYIRTKSVKSMTLGLPKSIKAKIHKVIRVGIGTHGLVVGSLSVGALVALLESVCTGQVYLPVIIFVAKSSELRTTAIFYLILYNLMFILPLVIVLVITYFGVKSENLGNFFGRHLALAKFIMALLFLGLGILLLVT